MKYRLPLLIAIISVCITAHAQKTDKNNKDAGPPQLGTDARAMQKIAETHHCCPREKNEQYYKDVAALFLKSMDPLRIYFNKTDVDKVYDLSALKSELEGLNTNYSKAITALYRQRLTDADKRVTDIAATPFDFTINETIVNIPDSLPFAADDNQLKDYMYKRMKFTALDRIAEAELLDSTLAKIPVVQREAKEREVAAKIRHRRIKQKLESKWGLENLISIYLTDAVAKAYDPHSEFVPSFVDKRNRYFSKASPVDFGLILEETYKGDVVVRNIIPGSSAWKSGMINKDDLLVTLQWDGQPLVDLEGADLDEVETAFAEKRYRKLFLTVKKSDGAVKTVQLMRGLYNINDERVESFILEGPVKIGYIILPSFYGDWESTYGSSCARDIDKNIEKMQFEVDGIILDMRNNGGGSLDEANQLAGIFIDEGPLGFLKTRGGFLEEQKDPYLGAQYAGPLVVMVNNESASATEYTAAALQDYNRAVIVGSPTFGKATAQRYLPADTLLGRFQINFGNFESQANDKVKVTMAKLYRVTGLNNQLRGVQPDIILPTMQDTLGYREQKMSHHLPLDTIKRKGVFDPFAPLPLQALRTNSAARIAQAPGFKLVAQNQQLYSQYRQMGKQPLPLQYNAFMQYMHTYIATGRKLSKQVDEDKNGVYKTKRYYRIPQVLNPKAPIDELREELEQNLLKEINEDIYVNEAFAIVTDLMKLKK